MIRFYNITQKYLTIQYFYVYYNFVLLHCFMKKTQKTPAREIEQAKRELADLIERGVQYE